jgi:Yip1 domain
VASEPVPDPQWIRDAARAIRHEVGSFLATLWLITTSPARFTAEWSSGQRTALNPFAFMLNAIAVTGPWHVLWNRILDPSQPTVPVWFELGVLPVFPIVTKVMIAAAIHGAVRLFGGRRPLRSSMAIAIYVSSGPVAMLSFVITPLEVYARTYPPDSLVSLGYTMVVSLTILPVYLIYLASAEAALHRLSRKRVVLAVLLAITVSSVPFVAITQAFPQVLQWMKG